MTPLTYFGTSDHSVILLNSIKNSTKLELKMVVTKPDKPVGRDQLLTETPVKKWCKQNNIPFITPTSLKKELEGVLASLNDYKTKLAVVADYGNIIPQQILDFYPKGIINIHFSLLPKYRGASPVTYALLNGDAVTGISFILTSLEMDKGGVIQQVPYTILGRETDESLYQKLFTLAGEHIADVIEGYLSGKLVPKSQDESQATYCTPSGKFDRSTFIAKDDAKIDFSWPQDRIERAIRAFYPWPVAWTTLEDLAAFFLKTPREGLNPKLKIKLTKADLIENKLVIFSVKPESGKEMDFKSFENGYLVS